MTGGIIVVASCFWCLLVVVCSLLYAGVVWCLMLRGVVRLCVLLAVWCVWCLSCVVCLFGGVVDNLWCLMVLVLCAT